MHYELYLDSLFLLNFGMNLLLLCLVDHSMGHTATWYRLLAGAVVGAVWYLFPFLWKGTAAGKLLLCFLPGTILMLYVTFHIRSLGTLWNYFRKLMLSTFLIGGILAALLRGFPMGRNYMPGIGMTLGVGAFSGWILVRGRKKEAEQSCYCEVVLQGAEGPLLHSCIGRLRQYPDRTYQRSTGIGAGRTDILSAVAGGIVWIPGDSLSQCREKERDP